MTAVSAVVCCYTESRWQQTCRAVESLLRQARPPDEVVVVVDHNDELFARAQRAFPGIIVIDNAYARGLSGARNSGVAKSSGDVVAFLDDDAEATADWLERLLRHYDSDSVLGASGLVRARWRSERPVWFPAEFDWVVGCSYLGLPDEVAQIRNPIGAGMSFRRIVIEGVGGFDESLGRVGSMPVGCEETELAIRARARCPQGYLVHDPDAIVDHDVAECRATPGYFFRRCWSEGRSKAMVTRTVGAGAGLSTERSYVLRTIPRAMVRELVGAFLRRGPGGLRRSALLVLGLLVTTCGYVRGRFEWAPQAEPVDNNLEKADR